MGLDLNALKVKKIFQETWELEICEYSESPRATYGTDVLDWWKGNEQNYPSLAKMARDN